MSTININPDPTSMRVSSPKQTVLSVLAALNMGEVSKAVDRFDDHFTFADHALGLEFTDKKRLIEFLRKSRERFPDTLVQADAIFESSDNVIVEWTLSATQTFPGAMCFRIPISLRGTSIVQVENGRVRRWSDYYDQLTSRRSDLAGLFKRMDGVLTPAREFLTPSVLEVGELTVLTGWAQAIAKAPASAPEYVNTLLANANPNTPWRTALQVAEPSPRLTEALSSLGRAVHAATPAGDTPTTDALLSSCREERLDERGIDRLVRRVLQCALEQLRTRQTMETHDLNGNGATVMRADAKETRKEIRHVGSNDYIVERQRDWR